MARFDDIGSDDEEERRRREALQRLLEQENRRESARDIRGGFAEVADSSEEAREERRYEPAPERSPEEENAQIEPEYRRDALEARSEERRESQRDVRFEDEPDPLIELARRRAEQDSESKREDQRIERGPSVDQQQETRREATRDSRGVDALARLRAAQGEKLPGDIRGPRAGERPGHEQLGDVLDKIIPADGPFRGDLLGHGERGEKNRSINEMPEGPEKRAAKFAKLEGDAQRFLEGGPIARIGKVFGGSKLPQQVKRAEAVAEKTARQRLVEAGLASADEFPAAQRQAAADRIGEMQRARATGGTLRTADAPVSAGATNNARTGSLQIQKMSGGDDELQGVIQTPGFARTAEQKVVASKRAGEIKTVEETEDILRNIHASVEPRVKQATRPMGWDETQKAAQARGESIDVAVSRLKQRGTTSVDLENVRQQVMERVGTVQRIAEKHRTGTATDEERLKAMESLYEAADAWAPLQGAASEAGRTLGILRKAIAQDFADGPSAAAYKAALGKLTKGGDVDDIFNALAKIDPNDTDALGGFLRDVTKPGAGAQWDEYYRANVLWGVNTHEKNWLSGLYQQGEFLATRTMANPQAAPALLHGWAYGWRRAFDRLPNILKEIDVPDKHGTIIPGGAIRGDIRLGTEKVGLTIPAKVVNPVGRVVRVPYTALGIGDAFQTAPMYNARLRELAWDAARAAKISIFDRSRHVKFMDDFINNRDMGTPALNARLAEARATALRESEEFALHGGGKAVDAMLAMRKAMPVMRPFVMFVKTPMNLAKIGARFSPLGLARAVPGFEKVAGYTERTLLTQTLRESAVIGGSLSAGFYGMLIDGNMTGLYPKSRNEAEEWKAAGKGPLQIRASEYPLMGPALRAAWGKDAEKRWVDASWLGPLLYPALVSAAAHRVATERSDYAIEEQIQMAAVAAGKTVLDQIPLFQGFKTINNAFQLDEAAAGIAEKLSRPAIPMVSLIQMVTTMSDGLRRKPEDLLQTLQAVFPGLSGNVPAATDVTGAEITNENTGFGVFLPRSRVERSSPVLDESAALRKAVPGFSGLGPIGDTVNAGANKVRLTGPYASEYERMAATKRTEKITALLADPSYAGDTPASRAKRFKAAGEEAAEEARTAIGLKIARESTDPAKVAEGAAIAVYSKTPAHERAKIVAELRDMGRLTPEAIDRIDKSWGAIEPAVLKEVVDGDTVRLDIPSQKDGTIKVTDFRLLRIDTPERGAGKPAASALQSFLAGKTLEVQYEKVEKAGDTTFGRVLAEIRADGVNVSDWLVQNGYATLRTSKSTDDRTKHLTVSELLEGHRLIEQWRRGTPAERALIQKHPLWGRFDSGVADEKPKATPRPSPRPSPSSGGFGSIGTATPRPTSKPSPSGFGSVR